MPSKLRQAGTWLNFCGDGYFTAYDPPHALVPETALLPVSAGDPKPVSVPSPTQGTVTRATVNSDGSTLKPAIIPTMDQPKATPNPPPTDNGKPGPSSQSKSPAASDTPPSDSKASQGSSNQGSDSQKGSDPNQGSDPKQDSNSQQNNDPNQGSKSIPGDRPDQGDDSKPGSKTNSNTEKSTNPSKSHLLPQALMGVINNRKPNGNVDAVVQNDPKQSDEANIAGAESGQNRPQVNVLKVSASPGPLDNPASDSKTPTQSPSFSEPFNALAEGNPITINNQVIQSLSYGISVAGTTITPGAPPITISGTPISYGPSLLAVGSSTIFLAADNRKSIVTNIAGQAVTIGQHNAVEIAGATLTPGAPALTVSGEMISLGSSILIVGTSTVSFQSPSAETSIISVAGYPITAAPDAVALAGTILHPGKPGVILDGTLISLDTAGQLIVGSKTMTLPGASLRSGRLADHSYPLYPDISDPLVTAIGGQTITAAPSAVAFAGTTLTPGASGKTIGGTPVSLNKGGQLVIGSKTIPLETDSGAGLGGLIMGGFGAGGPFGGRSPSPSGGTSSNGTGNRTSASVAVFQGGAESLKGGLPLWKTAVMSSVAMLVSFHVNAKY